MGMDPFVLWRNSPRGPVGRTAARGSYCAWAKRTTRATRGYNRKNIVNNARREATRHRGGCARKRMTTMKLIRQEDKNNRGPRKGKFAEDPSNPSWMVPPSPQTLSNPDAASDGMKEKQTKSYRSPMDPPLFPVRSTNSSRILERMNCGKSKHLAKSMGVTSAGYEISLPMQDLWRSVPTALSEVSPLVKRVERPASSRRVYLRTPPPRIPPRPNTTSLIRQRRHKVIPASPMAAPNRNIKVQSLNASRWIKMERRHARKVDKIGRSRPAHRRGESYGWVVGQVTRLPSY